MAYIGQVSIKNNSHMENAIDYISKEEKALNLNEFKQELQNRLEHLQGINSSIGEHTTCINCSSENTYKDFENMRKAFGQDKGVIAHHYFQSFQKDDDITPELAHKIGTELARKMFPDFQTVVATHIDREHIHNHIIVNSCNMLTGQKWYSNKKSLSDIRRESDRLCLQNGLSIIDKNSKYKGIDRTTYQLGIKGKSWKINLVKDLEDAIKICHSKEEFIEFLNKRDYNVRYKDIHITVTKNGEKKGIRVDTLAKQFGEKFKKENLEKAMGYYKSPPNDIAEKYKPKPKAKETAKTKSNWEYFEHWTFKQKNYYPSKPNNIYRNSQTDWIIKSAERSVFYSKNTFDFIIRFLLLMTAHIHRKKEQERYKVIQKIKISKPVQKNISYGNIDYKRLTQSAGDNFTIKLDMKYILKLVNQPILYSASLDRDSASATITIKAKDKEFLAQILELDKIQNQLETQNEKLSNQIAYKKLKQYAELHGEKLQYLIITPNQLQTLKDNFIEFAYFEKDNNFNIAFLPEKLNVIQKLIFSKKSEETEKQRNMRIYNQLKKASAQSGEKLKYRKNLTSAEIAILKKSGITFAYFQNTDNKSLFNIAFEKQNEEKIKILMEENKIKR